METRDQLHHRLDSLSDLLAIVKTMKALSAASIRQYEEAASAVAGYFDTVEQGLQVVLSGLPDPALGQRHDGPDSGLAAVVFGSDHGLCGRFNEDIVQYALERLRDIGADAPPRRILAVGARVAAALSHAGPEVHETFLVPGAADQIAATVKRILLQLDGWRSGAGVSEVHLFYNRHSGSRRYEPAALALLPVEPARFAYLRDRTWPGRSIPVFTMEREALLSRLVRQYLFVSLFRACAESQASEHQSRLAAMQAAQRNLDERLDEVTMRYRRARQNAITSELLDVVSGFEATGQAGA